MLAYFLNSVTDRHEMNESVLSLVPRFSTWRYPHLLLNAGACSRYRSINSCYAVPAAPGAQQQTFKCISSSHSVLDYRRIQLCTVVTQYPSFCQFTTPVGALKLDAIVAVEYAVVLVEWSYFHSDASPFKRAFRNIGISQNRKFFSCCVAVHPLCSCCSPQTAGMELSLLSCSVLCHWIWFLTSILHNILQQRFCDLAK